MIAPLALLRMPISAVRNLSTDDWIGKDATAIFGLRDVQAVRRSDNYYRKWSSDLNGFVGLVVREQSGNDVSWCIPSGVLCKFYWPLIVRFRIPAADRPQIHDRQIDYPNKELFGEIIAKDGRRLDVQLDPEDWTVTIAFECPHPPRGRTVTFVTYPDFEKHKEDAYELFAPLQRRAGTAIWFAEQEFYPGELFTVAAIAQGGETVLTCDLERLRRGKRQKKAKSGKAR